MSSHVWPPVATTAVKQPVVLTSEPVGDATTILTCGSISEISRLKDSSYILDLDGYKLLQARPMVYNWYKSRYPRDITDAMQQHSAAVAEERMRPQQPQRLSTKKIMGETEAVEQTR